MIREAVGRITEPLGCPADSAIYQRTKYQKRTGATRWRVDDPEASRKRSFGFLHPSKMVAFTPILGHLEKVGLDRAVSNDPRRPVSDPP